MDVSGRRLPVCMVGLGIMVIGLSMIFGHRFLIRLAGLIPRNQPLYPMFHAFGFSAERPWAIRFFSLFYGFGLVLFGFYIAWNAVTWPTL